jgi:hypothetical protein
MRVAPSSGRRRNSSRLILPASFLLSLTNRLCSRFTSFCVTALSADSRRNDAVVMEARRGAYIPLPSESPPRPAASGSTRLRPFQMARTVAHLWRPRRCQARRDFIACPHPNEPLARGAAAADAFACNPRKGAQAPPPVVASLFLRYPFQLQRISCGLRKEGAIYEAHVS